MTQAIFKVGDFIIQRGVTNAVGLIFACGPKTYDIMWQGGSTSRYRHGERDDIRIATTPEVDAYSIREHLIRDAAKARTERCTPVRERPHGMRIKRGQVWPSR